MLKNNNKWIPTAAAVVTSALLYFYSTGLNGIGALVFVAPLPILLLSHSLSSRDAFLAAFIAYLLGMLNLIGYLLVFAPAVIVAFLMIMSSLAFAFSVMLSRAAAVRMKPWLAVFAFPFFSTAFEFINSLLSPNGTAGSLAYTQAHFLPLIQVASITGIWGITFIATLVPAAFSMLWLVRRSKVDMLRTLAAPTILMAAVLIFGWIRLAEPRTQKPILVGLAATDTTIKYFHTTDPEKSLEVIRQYSHRARDLAGFGARVVVLPEKFAAVMLRSEDSAYSILTRTAIAGKVAIVAGLNDVSTRLDTNSPLVFFPDGKVLRYYKRFLVPGFETGYYSGDKPLVVPFGDATAGVEICKELDFPYWSREYGMRGVGLLFVPAWDFTIDGEFHMRMALLRGVESGFSIVRCAQQGLLTVSDYRGQIIAKQSTSGSPEVLLLSSVSPGPGKTFYTAAGNWFGWLSIAAALSFLIAIILKRPKRALQG